MELGLRDYSFDCSPALNRAEERVVRVAGKVGLQREATWVPVIISALVLALQEVWLPPPLRAPGLTYKSL